MQKSIQNEEMDPGIRLSQKVKNKLNKKRLNPKLNYSIKLSPSKHHYDPLNIGVYVENIQHMDGGIANDAKNINKSQVQ
jgi:hypothetical protein